jgi:hypothetical protein
VSLLVRPEPGGPAIVFGEITPGDALPIGPPR